MRKPIYYSKSRITIGFILNLPLKKIFTLPFRNLRDSLGKFPFTLSEIGRKVYFALFLSVKERLSSQNAEHFKEFLAKELSVFVTNTLGHTSLE